MIADKVRELEASSLNEDEIIEELTILAHESGFLLSNMISEDVQTSGRSLLEAVKEHFSIHQSRFPEHHHNRHSHTERVRRRRSRQDSYMRTISNIKGTGYCPWENQEGANEFVKGLGKSYAARIHSHIPR
jgi:predicted transposase YbfD/YdcC